jgi:UTP--glucose-1-phosphate uridylyltransferase
MTISKAVIPAAGLGTRMLPAAKAVPKELLPIVDRPTIQHVVEEAAVAALTDVLLITSPHKRGIEEHFRHNPELELRLAASGRTDLLASIESLMAKVRIHAVEQPRPLGLGDAVNQARRFIDNEPFVCLLGDAVFSGDLLPSSQLVAAAKALGTAVIGLEEVPPEKVDRYGIIAGPAVGDGIFKIETLVEKPSPANAPSRLAIAARYVLTPGIFDCLDRTPRGKGDEIQLTDALRLLLEREPMHGILLKATRHDIGNPLDWLKTNLALAARDPALRKQLQPLIESMLAGGARRDQRQ